ncbi:MAG: hypothetical protein WBG50_27635 [Desulfomonilaceae bacterium]
MIVLGIGLVIFFLVIGYLSFVRTETNSRPKLRGPVKDPARVSANRSAPRIGAIVLRLNRAHFI